MKRLKNINSTNKHLNISYEELIKNNLYIDSRAFANSVMEWCFRLGVEELTHLKLQRLMYYCYVFCIWNMEKLPFSPIEDRLIIGSAPFLGVMFSNVYNELRHYGNEYLQQDTVSSYKNCFLKYEQESKFGDETIDPIYKNYEIISNCKPAIVKSIQYVLIAIGQKTQKELGEMILKKYSDTRYVVGYETDTIMEENICIIQYMLEELASYNFFEDLYNKYK
jgi:uncharacterized phage-associated protein